MGFFKNIFSKSRHTPKEGGIFFTEMQSVLGFEPLNENHYRRAFTHRSSNKTDEKGNPVNYERLEFLGDAMLGSVIAAHLFNEVPTGDEGYLTKMRSKIVSREHLNELGRDLNLIKWVESKVSAQHFGENIHGNLFEALIGAIYLDRGFSYCEQFIQQKVIIPYVDIPKLEGKVISYKSLVIEWCQKEKKSFLFEIYEDNGVEGQKHFGVKLKINGEIVARARATSKKKAEEKAAQRAFFAFQEKINKK
ncbi:ribonuclease III [Flavobacterium sp. Sd200]|uniref:ribonuclease III n=1 Tax=Flavobacterium sp. Sd200 TaxID=2692211 RepID=UPI00136A0400|nr:ribonuclease III [Flavobacterium sp. Sd200]MXN91373.1 ribonuclease III [Flavobacterium sp. Sd200]